MSRCGLSLRRPPSELVRKRLALRREFQAHRIDAVALARRGRAVVEHVALVRVTAGADDFGSLHSVARVADGLEMPLCKRLREARPASAAFELGPAGEQRQPAQTAGEDARAFL